MSYSLSQIPAGESTPAGIVSFRGNIAPNGNVVKNSWRHGNVRVMQVCPETPFSIDLNLAGTVGKDID